MKSRLLSFLSFIVGVLLFLFLVRNTGISELSNRIAGVGYGFIAILGLALARQFARTFAWLRCMSDDDRSLGFLAVWKARLAGDALSDLTAAGPLIGEPVKLAALGDARRMRDLASSLAIENLLYSLSCAVLIASGAATLLSIFGISDSLRTAGLISTLASLGLILLVLVIVGNRLAVLSAVLSRVRGAKEKPWLAGIRSSEKFVFDFFQFRRGDFLAALMAEFLFHLCAIAEMWLAIYLLSGSTSLVVAFVLESVNRVINVVFAFVPALMGVDEAGSGILAAAVGLGGSVGISLALIRKCRMLVFIVVGLAFLLPSRAKQSSVE